LFVGLGILIFSSVRLLSLSSTKLISAIFCSLLAASLLSGCGTPGIPLPPSLELPKPAIDLHARRKGNKVYLSWTVPVQTTDRQTIRHLGTTRICRSLKSLLASGVHAKDECGNEVGTVLPPTPTSAPSRKTNSIPPAKTAAKYVDELPAASTDIFGEFTYAVEVLNDRGRSAGLSNRAPVPAAPTLPPPANFAARVTADGVVLSWTSTSVQIAGPGLRYLYRVYRRGENSKETIAGEFPLDALPNSHLTDHNFEWEMKYSYRATVVTLIDRGQGAEAQIEGDDTPAVDVFTHDTFPPAVPSGLQAVFSSENQQLFVDLIWNPDTENDLAGYNIFRREGSGPVVRINSDLVKLPAFRDFNVSGGKRYAYSVSAVDTRGNESVRSAEANELVP
jgi:hypothetical protein